MTLLQRAQRAGGVRDDIDIDDLFALLAGAFATRMPRPSPTMPPASTRSFSMDSARGADASRSSVAVDVDVAVDVAVDVDVAVAVAVAARRDACRLSCEDFAAADPHRRLALNDRVHDLPKASHAIRHFLSSVASAQVCTGLSEAYGTPVRFQSFDISRLRAGQYLRRHSDALEARVFGLVFHLSAGWHDGCGGELVGEGSGGECMVFRPHQGGVCLIQIGPDREHSVCVVRSADYVRYSIAVHYALATDHRECRPSMTATLDGHPPAYREGNRIYEVG